jgi:serine/threonine protein kinase
MPTLSELADVLVGCRVVTAAQWEQAADADEDLAGILDALAGEPPHWWDRKPPAPPGLTDYQRDRIEVRFDADELDQLRHDLALNSFLLLEKLGQGGQGAVYRGRQLNPPRFAAVKTLMRNTDVGRRRFEQEARTMMKIQHPSVARFYLYERVRDTSGRPTDEYVIAMELVPGTDLFRLVWRVGRIPWPFVVRWIVELLGGLTVIHRSGFIHRDVKPENVMISGPAPGLGVAPEATSAKLLDFGAVRLLEGDEIPGGKLFVGTMEYAPPEQWTGELVAASDLYALGCTLFYALTGRTPFQKRARVAAAYRHSHTHDETPLLPKYNPGVPGELDRLFRQMLAKDPVERGTAAELAEEFQRLLPRPTAPPPPPPPSPAAPARLVSTPVPKASPRPSDEHDHDHEHRSPIDRALGPVLAVLERLFVPARLRPQRGHEPAFPDRVAALLRRPALLITLAILILLLVFWAVR